MDRKLAPRLFDPTEPLVALRSLNLTGEDRLAPGDPIPDDVLTDGQKLRLWMCSHVVYAKDWHPTPTVDDIDPTTQVVDPVEVEKAVAELEASSAPSVTIAHIGGGYYQLTPSWDETLSEKVNGKEAAAARQEELLASAPVVEPPQPEAVETATEQPSQPEAQPEAPAQPEPVPAAESDAPKE